MSDEINTTPDEINIRVSDSTSDLFITDELCVQPIDWNTLTFTDPRDEEIKELKNKIKELEEMIVEHILLDKHDAPDKI